MDRMRLSPTQKAALRRMESGKAYSAYDLNASLPILDALVNKGLIERKQGLGKIYTPHTGILFKKINPEDES